jgi:RNA polymerase sigma-70 factor (ECF subfamily)
MHAGNDFADFVRRLRAGDARAAEELVRRYEPVIRLDVRLRLRDPRLRRLFDSVDVSQSVLATFFAGAAAGDYRLDHPGQLVNLLAVITHGKLADQVRRQRARRRDSRRVEPLDSHAGPADAGPSPSEVVMGDELRREFRERLSREEQQLADLRAAGRSWTAIAHQMGGTPAGRRVQLRRAVRRVARLLGLAGGPDE